MGPGTSGAAASTGTVRRVITRVVEWGRAAHDIVFDQTVGVVCAVFQRSCYLEFSGRRVICVGERVLGRGPLNALVARFEPPLLGAEVQLRAHGATVWRPSTRSARPQRAALEALRAAARERVPREGLGGLVSADSTPLIENARPAFGALARWLEGGALGAEAEMLLGLGPGLTPSGDDYLGGVLVALRVYGRAADADALWRWLGPRLPARTSMISAAHLAAAAEGEAHEALHACIEALAEDSPGEWPARLEWLASIGHCSGWDGLAGVMAVAERVAV
jgi:hypothetical protein